MHGPGGDRDPPLQPQVGRGPALRGPSWPSTAVLHGTGGHKVRPYKPQAPLVPVGVDPRLLAPRVRVQHRRRGGIVGPDDLPLILLNTARQIPAGLFEDLPSLEEVERRYLEHVLRAVGRNRTRAADVLGIDQGPILIMAENHRTGAVWRIFMREPVVQRGMAAAGFTRLEATAAE